MSTDVLDTSVAPKQNDNDKRQRVQSALDTTMNLICTKLEDPNFSASELMRLVTLEIAMLVMQVRSLGFRAEERHIAHCLFELLRPLRELRHSIRDTDSLRERTDLINWDGEAIHHVIATLVKWFEEALKEAGLREFERAMVMRSYRDLAAVNEPQLRRETER